jgi:hypothetical protein
VQIFQLLFCASSSCCSPWSVHPLQAGVAGHDGGAVLLRCVYVRVGKNGNDGTGQ